MQGKDTTTESAHDEALWAPTTASREAPAAISLKDEPEGKATPSWIEFASGLKLAENDPGLNDERYVARRTHFFHVARKHRLGALPFPEIEYEPYEHDTWRAAYEGLEITHQKWASREYLAGKRVLGMSPDRLPRVTEVCAVTERATGVGIVPAEGMLAQGEFFSYLAQKKLPCSIFLRHGSHPEFGTEPDLVHDLVGHLPMLVKPDYVRFTHLLGRVAQRLRTDEERRAIERIYLFTIEFGLIEEDGDIKVAGAGLLSSYSEMQHIYTSGVELRPLDIDEIIDRTYNFHTYQTAYYVIPSFDKLVESTCKFIRRLGFDPERV
jgi:phenylalanine-4-hydroxylase